MVQCGVVRRERDVSVRAAELVTTSPARGCHVGDAVSARRRLGVGEQAAAGAARHGQCQAREECSGELPLCYNSPGVTKKV